jgi:hypothetical protein
MKRIVAILLLFGTPVALCFAEMPVRTEQLIWSVLAFNGRDYAATFVPEHSDSLYLIAGVDNFLSARKTLVYWWPITEEWRTDTDSLNQQFAGALELRDGGGKPRTFPLQQYTYYNMKGEYELNWKVVTGKEAEAELEKYSVLYDSYFKAVREYQKKSQEFESELQSLSARITRLRKEKKDFAPLLERMKTLPKPEAPKPPTYYVVPPTSLQQAFILNLAPGRYAIRLLNPDGTVMEGSDKTVYVHDRRRSGGVGYEVIPSDKWTRPVESVTPASVLYVNGSADLFLRPFHEDEFNDLAFEKTLNNSSRGNPNIVKWVRIQQVPKAKIETAARGAGKSLLDESPFIVEQAKGSSLGYTIKPWVAGGQNKDRQPDLIAMRVPIDKKAPAIRIRTLDGKGDPLPGSDRQIRVVSGFRLAGVLFALALLPLLAMAIVLSVRARTYAASNPGGRRGAGTSEEG